MSIDVTCIGCSETFQQAPNIFNRSLKFRILNPGSEKGLYCKNSCFKKALGIKLSARNETQCAVCMSLIHIKPFRKQSSKTKIFTCSKECKAKAMSVDLMLVKVPHFGNGKHEYRKRALNVECPKCNKCGYNKNSKMLDVHHIDGNRNNNKIDNLEILCVWCHALVTRQVEFHLPSSYS